VPGFWLATLVILLPAIWWGWTPNVSFTEFGQDPAQHVLQFLLPPHPRRGLGGRHHAPDARHAARGPPAGLCAHGLAKGLDEGVVVLKHSLKNALIPVVTILASSSPRSSAAP